MDRNCGYCRKSGHNKSKCPVLLYKLDLIRKYVPSERKNIITLITKNGYGVGAIVNAYSWRAGHEVNAVIASHDFISTCSMVEYRNVKYQKRSRVTLKNFSGYSRWIIDPTLGNSEVFLHNTNSLSFSCINLSDPSENVSCNIVFNDLEYRIPDDAPRRGYTYDSHTKVVVPSYETDVTDNMLIKNIYLSERLGPKNVEGIVTW